jgi:PST family polysaccharide transporter
VILNLLNKILPIWISKRIVGDLNKDGIKKYFHNTSWLFVARIITFITSFLTMALVARYLGPENLGKLSYAQSLVAILSVLASLGMDQILYRDLVAYRNREIDLLETAIIAKFFFGAIAFLTAVAISLSIGDDFILTLLIGITAFTFLINPLGTIGILFQAHVKAKYTSQVAIFLAFFIPILKILTIYFDEGIIYFALTLVIEAIVTSIWYLYIYISHFKENPLHWRFQLDIFKNLMKDSWPFLLAGLFAYIYARIDQVMLQHYIGSHAVGLYDTAVKLSNMWSFFPALIIASLFPAIVQAKKHSRLQYIKRYSSLTVLIAFITVSITLFVFLTADYLILLIFGEQYIESIPILKIYIWSGAMAIMGIMVQQYLITENRGVFNLILAMTGAVVNIVLNLFLIPLYGMTGAAIATLFSYSILPFGLLFLKQFREDVKTLRNQKI